jgi:hypothetical protein
VQIDSSPFYSKMATFQTSALKCMVFCAIGADSLPGQRLY